MLLANLLDSLSLHKEKNTIGHAVIEEYKTVGWGDVALNMIIFLLVFYSSYTAAIWYFYSLKKKKHIVHRTFLIYPFLVTFNEMSELLENESD